MQKKYIVRLTDQEREVCQQTVRKLNGSNEKVRRAQILLKADADGPAWTDQQIADALSCRTKTVENIRQRCVLEGFERALERKRRPSPPVPKLLDGEQEAQVIALRLGPPPKGYANWSLRLLARRVVELEVVESVSHETIRPARARELVRRLEFCYTPKHGSWLNIAENELSSMTRQCLDGRRHRRPRDAARRSVGVVHRRHCYATRCRLADAGRRCAP